MRNTILSFLIFTAFLVSCSDPCKDINCGSNGTCEEGVCICDDGAFGDNCDQLHRDFFVDDWMTTSHSCDVGNSLDQVYTFTEGTNINELVLTSSISSNLNLIVKVDVLALTIEEQVLDLGVPVTHSGSGSFINDVEIEIVITQESDGQPARTCTYVLMR